MKQLIKHLLNENLDYILNKSLVNCHVKGLHSLVFTEKPLIRLFITDINHEMWKNTESNNFQDLSVGIHNHHCNLTLECIYGRFVNYQFINPVSGGYLFQKWQYQSAINSKECKFLLNGYENLALHITQSGIGSHSIHLNSNDLHTIWVQKGQKCAWFVYEGQENPNYTPLCYSNNDLTNFDSSELYKPMDRDFLMYLLKSINLL